MDLVIQNLVSPIVLCFALGLVAHWVKSDFELPDAVYQALRYFADNRLRLLEAEAEG